MGDSGSGIQTGPRSPEGPELLPVSPPLAAAGVTDAELAEVIAEATAPVANLEAHEADARSFRMRRLMAFTDIAALCGAWVVTGAFLDAIGRTTATMEEFLLFVVFLPVWVLFGSLAGLYHGSDRRVDPSIADEAGKLLTLVTAWTWGYLLVRGAVESGTNQLLPAVGLWALVFLALVTLRPIARHYAHTRPWYWQNVIVVGEPVDVDRVWRRLIRHPEYGLRAVDSPDVWEELSSGEGVDRLVRLVQEKRIARVMVASTLGSVEGRGRVVRRLRDAGVQVDLATGSADSFAPSVMLNYLEGIPVMSVPVVQRSKAMRVMKRLFDLVAGSLALVVFSPLLLFCVARIKLDSRGPVFFRQLRIGKDGEPFLVFKFRSMVQDADSLRGELLGVASEQQSGPSLFKMRDDPRVTKFGATIRRWSLDELPQLLNVVRGDMSLVGPRPLPVDEVERIRTQLNGSDELFDLRFKVLPGVTGAWQAHGRSDIGFEDMVQLDYMYVTNWSFSEDLKLILRTVEVILHGRGAY